MSSRWIRRQIWHKVFQSTSPNLIHCIISERDSHYCNVSCLLFDSLWCDTLVFTIIRTVHINSFLALQVFSLLHLHPRGRWNVPYISRLNARQSFRDGLYASTGVDLDFSAVLPPSMSTKSQTNAARVSTLELEMKSLESGGNSSAVDIV